MKRHLLCAGIFIVSGLVHAVDWPASDNDLDTLLRDLSPKYREMAESVAKLHGYRIETSKDVRLGNVAGDEKGLVIQLNPTLTNERRATVLIWEMANAFQRPRFDEIDHMAKSGTITTPREFGLRMELVEYDSFRHHKEVLDQLVSGRNLNERELFFFINEHTLRLSDYVLPYVHDYIKAQAASGHTRHYESWFYRQAPKRGRDHASGDNGSDRTGGRLRGPPAGQP